MAAKAYDHKEQAALLRPDIGVQAQCTRPDTLCGSASGRGFHSFSRARWDLRVGTGVSRGTNQGPVVSVLNACKPRKEVVKGELDDVLFAAGLRHADRLHKAAEHVRHADPAEAAWWLGLMTRPGGWRARRALRILVEAVK